MAQKGFGVKELNIAAAASGNPAIEAVTDELDLKAAKIGISTDIQVGRNVNAVGILTASSVNDVAGNVRQIVSNSKSTTYQIVKSDVGELINTTAGVTVPANLSPALVAGDAITIYNNSASDITITQGSSVTMYQAGTSNTGNRVLAQRGVATVLCVGTNTFTIIGGGLS
tara:strand:- start:6323 stop:6832 length:510 start_codon:yes stop_codon:yes gene_type:complete